MATMRELKGRINSVHSSQKITGAMKMISSARLRKAENKLLQAEPYRRKLWEIYAHIEKSGCEFQSPLTVKRQVKKVAIVIFASDDGLCGAFNINLYKKLVEEVQAYQKRGIREITVFPVGKKILAEVKRIKGIRLARHPEAFEKKDYMAPSAESTTLYTELRYPSEPVTSSVPCPSSTLLLIVVTITHFIEWYRCGICLYRGLSGGSCAIIISACSSRPATAPTSYSNVCDICGGTNTVWKQWR